MVNWEQHTYSRSVVLFNARPAHAWIPCSFRVLFADHDPDSLVGLEPEREAAQLFPRYRKRRIVINLYAVPGLVFHGEPFRKLVDARIVDRQIEPVFMTRPVEA